MGDRRLEIVLAANAGFCMGVRRALKLTLDAANRHTSPRPIATVGPLIHNRHVLEILARKGIVVLDGRSGGAPGTAVIRAHGVSPAERDRLNRCARRVIDATCPHVRRVQRIAEKYCAEGYHCLVVGDRGHGEVEGVLSHARGRGIVVSRLEDLEGLPPMDKVAVVAQTTQDPDLFADVVEKVRREHPDCLVFDTICRSTRERQAEAEGLARRVDVMVVVGGFDSANTRRLAGICARTGTPTYHVESAEELDIDRLLECRRIGVTAGASTPHWMIQRVLSRIRAEHGRRRRSLSHLLQRVLAVPVRINFFIGGGAAAIAYTSSRLMGVSDPLLGPCMALAFFFITAQHLLNQYSKREVMELNEPDRGAFFKTNSAALGFLGGASGALALLLGALLGWLPFVLVLAGTVGGLLYGLPTRQRGFAAVPVRILQRMPGSKELFVGLAWAVTTALVPAVVSGALAGHWRGAAVAILFAFLLAFHRTLLTDVQDMEGDQILGRESLALLLGARACKGLMAAVLCVESLVLLAAGLLGWASPLAYLLLGAVGYSAFWSIEFHRGRLPEAELGEALIDAKFYICGLLALAGSALL